LDPKNGHFWSILAILAKKQPDQATFWLGRTPLWGSKSAIFRVFFHFPGGVPGFCEKRALNNGNLSWLFSCFATKMALFGGGYPQKYHLGGVRGHFDPPLASVIKQACKEIAFARHGYFCFLIGVAQCNGFRWLTGLRQLKA